MLIPSMCLLANQCFKLEYCGFYPGCTLGERPWHWKSLTWSDGAHRKRTSRLSACPPRFRSVIHLGHFSFFFWCPHCWIWFGIPIGCKFSSGLPAHMAAKRLAYQIGSSAATFLAASCLACQKAGCRSFNLWLMGNLPRLGSLMCGCWRLELGVDLGRRRIYFYLVLKSYLRTDLVGAITNTKRELTVGLEDHPIPWSGN